MVSTAILWVKEVEKKNLNQTLYNIRPLILDGIVKD